MGLKREHRLKTAQKASRSKFIAIKSHDAKKNNNLVFNGAYGVYLPSVGAQELMLDFNFSLFVILDNKTTI